MPSRPDAAPPPPSRLGDRLLERAADAVLAWSARGVEPARLAWIEALRGELAHVEGAPARLSWALGALSLACIARRRSLSRPWYSWPALMRTSGFGLVLSAVLVAGIVWSNVVVPSHESDSEYTTWYAVFYAGLLVYFFVAGLVVAGRPASIPLAAVTGAVTAVLVALIVLVTFVVIDNLFLSVVMQQPDKASGFAHSGLTSQRDYVNNGNLEALLLVPALLGALGAGLGALGGLVRTRVGRREPAVPV
ncbi:MAG TPA: hypothetical protein VE953_08045 [Terriglobales bacterium]|nr:hypothetical protein [Terriglobales bacterium]